jgi:hypothetical protein
MRLALNGATTMKADLATDIAAAGRAGFDGLEIKAHGTGDCSRPRGASRFL